jgi:hypothetical protein
MCFIAVQFSTKKGLLMNKVNRHLAWSMQAVLLGSAGLAGAAHADPIIALLQSQAATILAQDQVNLGTDGTAAGAVAGPCFTAGCLPTPVGGVLLNYTSGSRIGQTAASASVALAGASDGQAAATVPTATDVVQGGFGVSDNSATATELGITGSFAAAAAASWDTLTFQGASNGQTGTLSLVLTLASPTTPFTAVGTGGGCISIGSVCDPFANQITGAGATETLTTTIPLNASLLVFNALYAVADNDPNLQVTTIDPNLVLTLPSGVSFTSVSGNSGGSSSLPTVPEPGSLALFGAAALLLAFTGRLRRRRAQ